MWSFSRAAVRAYLPSFLGSFLIVAAAAALLSANGVLLETGLSNDEPLLATVASSFAGTAILVVILVVASTFAGALRQRETQLALLRAVGATSAQVRSMVTAEVVLVFAAAAPLGAIPGLFAAQLLMPALESGAIVSAGTVLQLSPLPVIGALLLLFPTALLAARLVARKVTRVSPTVAVRDADLESAQLSPARRMTALGLLAAGILAAGTPFFVPGTLGSAAGSTSAFLLISAGAVGGPAIVGAVARRAAGATRWSGNAAGMLALANTRGFSRRLTAAIIPLALFLALGTVQTGVNGSMVDAAGQQLREGLGADAVITSTGGVTAEQVAAVASTPGIEAVVASSTVVAEIKVDDDEELSGLSWEQTAVRAIDGSPATLIDADVTSGSLDDLSGPATIAASSESLFGTGKGVGDNVSVRFDGSDEFSATIVAVYERGLGFGEYIVDTGSLPTADRPSAADVLFARGSADVAPVGVKTVSLDDYVDETVAGAASQQQLSAILLFALIFFIAVAAANTPVMTTSARRAEFTLLRRIGATRRQLTSMIAAESLFVMATTVVIGTLAVIPALVGVSYGMLGSFWPAIDWPVFGALVATVVLITAAAMVLPARLASRGRV